MISAAYGTIVENELSVLIIAYYFPPNAAVGGKRLARFCRYLPEFGIQPTVVTLDQDSCATLDNSLANLPDTRVERARPNSTPLDWYQRITRSRSAEETSSASFSPSPSNMSPLRFLSKSVVALLTIPDQYWGWYFPAVKAAARLMKERKFDAILSSGPPWTAHAVAHRFARRFDIPWIADFRDGWVSDQWRDEHPDWRYKVDWWIENRWVEDASLILATTNALRNSLLSTHPDLPEDRIVTITNGFDENLPVKKGLEAAGEDNHTVLLHAGELYRGRRIDAFCSALANLLHSGAFGSKPPKVVFLGGIEPEIEQTARSAAPELFDHGIVEFRPRIAWKEVQAKMSAADILLLVQGDHPTAIPAKFFEYLQSGKPILGIGQGAALKEIIEATQSGFVADSRDAHAIAAALKRTLQMKPRTPQEVSRFTGNYHFKRLSERLADNIRRIVTQPQLAAKY
ncbi:MAG TPA: glycosyltransferase [Terriglobales bacterium]|nr:glycosyltransferase [Terriglobales bacterium]